MTPLEEGKVPNDDIISKIKFVCYNVTINLCPILKHEGGTRNVDLDWYSRACYSDSVVLHG